MNLRTNYLGLSLKNPLIVGASPMVDDVDLVCRLEEAGAAAIVMHSLFEEQIMLEERAYATQVKQFEDSFSEASTFFGAAEDFALTPDSYLEQIRKVKAAVSIPVIASLNGTTPGGWVRYAKLMEEAGADALELNYYDLPFDPGETRQSVENTALVILRMVRSSVSIPVSFKISPFFTALSHFVRKVADAGATGLVIFNRFYQPDIDIEFLETLPTLQLSDPSELRLRLRWLAVLYGTPGLALAANGGVHSASDVIKSIMAGADVVQMVSVLLKYGPEKLAEVLNQLTAWLHEHEYDSLDELRGIMSLQHCPDPSVFERANYMQILQTWRV